jgi:hypothetical protein
LRLEGREGDFGGFGVELDLDPTSIPPMRAKDIMAWFIFDTFMAASPRQARGTRRRARLTGAVPS